MQRGRRVFKFADLIKAESDSDSPPTRTPAPSPPPVSLSRRRAGPRRGRPAAPLRLGLGSRAGGPLAPAAAQEMLNLKL
jgi:hypothetical protein